MQAQNDWELDHHSVLPLKGKIWFPFLLVSFACIVLCVIIAILAGPIFYSWIGLSLMAICLISFVAGLLLEGAVGKILTQPNFPEKSLVTDSTKYPSDYHKIQNQLLKGEHRAGVEVTLENEPMIKNTTLFRNEKEENPGYSDEAQTFKPM